MSMVTRPIIIHDTSSQVQRVIGTIIKKGIFIRHDAVFLDQESYPIEIHRLEGIEFSYVFFIGRPATGTQDMTIDLIKQQLPFTRVIKINIPINENDLIEVICRELGMTNTPEGQQMHIGSSKEN